MNSEKIILLLASIQAIDKKNHKLWNKKPLCRQTREKIDSPFDEYYDIELKHTQK